ncbi:MAG: Peptidyl-prolyl cis-trans isomerase (EC [uncultured Sulfurovum sp.]|uniref:Peptidyl-prolyl cis-trans isomerase n=1 Tax=uncultured Sulfurovum sp. TaxID=269237 RepID=A0A6S6TLQ2_9BACT|nr:MAG: Peptidyl-prolyl cis-trans isomerase (EC [uncultured Sulfurovum sp.]
MKKRIGSIVVVLMLVLTGCNAKDTNNTQKIEATSVVKNDEKKSESTIVILETNQGNIALKMFRDVAPLAVENFVTHAKNGYYDGLIFHRVIKDFMIQGGDPTGTGRGGESIFKDKSGKKIEFANEHKPNVVFDRPFLLAMANRGPNTNGSQFFITTRETPFLNGRHTIFGEVVSGKEVVEKIENTKTQRDDTPMEKQIIKKATIK